MDETLRVFGSAEIVCGADFGGEFVTNSGCVRDAAGDEYLSRWAQQSPENEDQI